MQCVNGNDAILTPNLNHCCNCFVSSLCTLHLFHDQVKDVHDDNAVSSTTGMCLIGQYGIAEHIYDVNMPQNGAVMIKLADFGTADINTDTMGQPVGIDHYTTLENTPPEQLFYGSNAVQDYVHDTFGMGLATLHMFTGQVSKMFGNYESNCCIAVTNCSHQLVLSTCTECQRMHSSSYQ
jgi:hypothetical protein